MVAVNLIKQQVREVHFVNALEKPGQIQLENSFNFRVDYMNNNQRCVAKLYHSAKMKDDPDKLFVSVDIIGMFQLEGVTSEEAKREAHVQCYNQLFPYLQSVVTQMTTAGGLPGFMMKKGNITKDNIRVSDKKQSEDQPPMTLPIVCTYPKNRGSEFRQRIRF